MATLNFFKSSIRWKLGSGFGSIIFLILLLTITTFFYLDRINTLADEIIPYSNNMVNLNSISVSLESIENNIDKYLILGSSEYKENYNLDIDDILERIPSIKWDLLNGRLIEFKTSIQNLNEALATLESPEFAKGDARLMNNLYIRIYSELKTLKQIDNEFLLKNINYLKENVDEQKRVINRLNLQFIVIVLIIILVGVLISYFTSISISKPIEELESASKKVSGGNLNIQVPVKSKDEIALLAKSFNHMTHSLHVANEKIKRYNIELENKVRERTAELQVAYNELKSLDTEKDIFISVATHELKTPLTSIKGFVNLLLDKDIPCGEKKKVYYLELIKNNTKRLFDLVIDLLDSTKLSLGKIKIDKSNLEISKICRETKGCMGIILTENNIKAVCQHDPNLPNVIGDMPRVQQVLRNLIINAVRATPEGGTISLSASKKGRFVQFEVKDTGMGIPDDKKKYIFTRFYSLKKGTQGSGLGLSICKGLVELMKGKIWFESVPGKGTTFFFTLPIAKTTEKSKIKSKSKAAKKSK
ncbi:MAG: HAMP domain-containing sensor histidine kinase [Nanoarchaeota archaeon]|nr:HAMP domain-containing sensor histidine kinase [Nanoarchaeota archaeon]